MKGRKGGGKGTCRRGCAICIEWLARPYKPSIFLAAASARVGSPEGWGEDDKGKLR